MRFTEPKKCGELYVHYDENNEQDYAFYVKNKGIIKFFVTKDHLPEYIVLPNVNRDANVLTDKEYLKFKADFLNMPDDEKYMMSYKSTVVESYLVGNICICPECFKEIKKAKIVVPFNTSIMLDWGCFDDEADVEFILPKNMGLKQIFRRFDAGYDCENENWTLLADKALDVNIVSFKEYHISRDFQPKNSRVNYKISREKIEEDGLTT